MFNRRHGRAKEMHVKDVRWVLGFAAIFFGAAVCAAAEIVVAQVSPFSGPLKAGGEAYYLGAKAYFGQANAQGGFSGNKVRLVREDDAYKPDETVRSMKNVAERDKPIAFINLIGSANATALIEQRVLDDLRIPVVGVTPGAESSRSPGSPYLFHIQAGDRAQLDMIMSHLGTLGLRRVSVIYQDVPSGRDGASFVEQSVGAKKLVLQQKVAVMPGSQDLSQQVAQLKSQPAEAYIMILASNFAGMFVAQARKQGDRTPIYGLSYITAQDIVSRAGVEGAAGVALAQTSPNAATATTGVMRDFQAAMRAAGAKEEDLSASTFSGYLAARVVGEALRRSGTSPTPAALSAALRNTRLQLGGYALDFTRDNVGSRQVDIAVIDAKGRLRY